MSEKNNFYFISFFFNYLELENMNENKKTYIIKEKLNSHAKPIEPSTISPMETHQSIKLNQIEKSFCFVSSIVKAGPTIKIIAKVMFLNIF